MELDNKAVAAVLRAWGELPEDVKTQYPKDYPNLWAWHILLFATLAGYDAERRARK